MSGILNELISELNTRGANFVRVVDISMLPANQNQGFNIAIIFGIVLSPGYIHRLSKENISDRSEFNEKEDRADKLAEWTADFIILQGYKAFAQSEKNMSLHGYYDEITKISTLPHKTIANMSGLGWMGKNDLLVTREYGCAICICTVLTNAPLPTENNSLVVSKCGKCTVCIDTCQPVALHGSAWIMDIDRDLMVDIHKCNMCLKCLANCPWTQKYMKRHYKPA